jgi:hypothetical protein
MGGLIPEYLTECLNSQSWLIKSSHREISSASCQKQIYLLLKRLGVSSIDGNRSNFRNRFAEDIQSILSKIAHKSYALGN